MDDGSSISEASQPDLKRRRTHLMEPAAGDDLQIYEQKNNIKPSPSKGGRSPEHVATTSGDVEVETNEPTEKLSEGSAQGVCEPTQGLASQPPKKKRSRCRRRRTQEPKETASNDARETINDAPEESIEEHSHEINEPTQRSTLQLPDKNCSRCRHRLHCLYPGPGEATSSDATSNLNDLPEELVEQIALHLNGIRPRRKRHRRGDPKRYGYLFVRRYLYNFCLISKKFCRIAKPFLYSVFIPRGIKSHNHLDTIFKHPNLATCLRTLVLPSFPDEGQSWMLPVGTRSNMIKHCQKIKLADRSMQSEWLQKLSDGDFDAEISLLMTLAPNLELLDLQDGRNGFAWAVGFIRQLGLGGRLPRLRHIIIRSQSFPGGLMDHCVQELLRLPSLRKIELIDAWALEQNHTAHGWPSRISAVDTVVLQDMAISPGYLDSVLGACRELKSFSWRLGGLRDCQSSDPRRVLRALERHSASLETLPIECWSHIWPHRFTKLPIIDGLGGFTRLRHLDVVGVILFAKKGIGYDALPPSLESLSFDCVSIGIKSMPQVLALLEDIAKARRRGCLPHFRFVGLTVPLCMWDPSKRKNGPPASEWKRKVCVVARNMCSYAGLEEFRVRVAGSRHGGGKVKAWSLNQELLGRVRKPKPMHWVPSIVDGYWTQHYDRSDGLIRGWP